MRAGPTENRRWLFAWLSTFLPLEVGVRRKRLRPTTTFLLFTSSPEPDSDSGNTRKDEERDDDCSSDDSFRRPFVRVGAGDILEDRIGRLGRSICSSASLEGTIDTSSRVHCRSRIVGREHRSSGAGGIPSRSAGVDDAELKRCGGRIIPPFREESSGILSIGERDALPDVDETVG